MLAHLKTLEYAFSAEEAEAPMVEEGRLVYLQMALFSTGVGNGGRFALFVLLVYTCTRVWCLV